MKITGANVQSALRNGDITVGMVYTKPNGVFMITDLDGNGSGIIGHAAECDYTDDGDVEPIEKPHHITAVDLIGAEF